MKTMHKKLVLDAALSAFLVFEMLYSFTGNALHEIGGMVFFAAIIAHLVMARKWTGGTVRALVEGRKLKAANKARVVLNTALGIDMLVLMITSIGISNLLYGLGVNLAGSAYETLAVVHTASAYVLCCLVAVHLATHWVNVAAAFRIPYNHERRVAISTGMSALAALGVVAIGGAGVSSIVQPLGLLGDAAEEGSANAEDAPAGSAESATTARHGHGKHSGASQVTGFSTSTSSVNAASGEAPSANTTLGTCTICRKNCQLSDPRCDRPYQAGLI